MILVKNFSVTGVVFGEHSWRFPDDTRRRLADLLDAFSKGRLKPTVMKTYPLMEAQAALAEMSSRRVIGKLVLVPPGRDEVAVPPGGSMPCALGVDPVMGGRVGCHPAHPKAHSLYRKPHAIVR